MTTPPGAVSNSDSTLITPIAISNLNRTSNIRGTGRLLSPTASNSGTSNKHSEPATIVPHSTLSKFLAHPQPSDVPQRSLPHARLLTSNESLAMLEEKENRKNKELEEKERRKQERLENK